MITAKDIQDARRLAETLDLEGKEHLLDNSIEKILSVVNGIGPGWFPKPIRKLINKLNPSLVPVSMIHDLDWHFADGTEEHFKASNMRFRRNGYKIADYKYPWYNHHRYIVRFQSWEFSRVCSKILGWMTYKALAEKRKEEEYEAKIQAMV